MPCAYAHLRFGREILPKLPPAVRDAVMQYKELYEIGVHGPDVLFYHSPMVPDKITRLGHSLHHKSGAEVFGQAARVLDEHPEAMYRAYMYGYLAHFALDCMCHGYVNKFAREHDTRHNEIEMEFDRLLEVEDGLDPLRHDTAAHIVPSRRNSAVIAAFYPGAELRDIQRSLKSMIFCLRVLHAPNMRKRKALLAAFRATGRYRDLAGLVMSLEPSPVCRESSKRLSELYKLAVPLAVKLISEFDRVREGKAEPDRHLELDFLSEKPGRAGE